LEKLKGGRGKRKRAGNETKRGAKVDETSLEPRGKVFGGMPIRMCQHGVGRGDMPRWVQNARLSCAREGRKLTVLLNTKWKKVRPNGKEGRGNY